MHHIVEKAKMAWKTARAWVQQWDELKTATTWIVAVGLRVASIKWHVWVKRLLENSCYVIIEEPLETEALREHHFENQLRYWEFLSWFSVLSCVPSLSKKTSHELSSLSTYLLVSFIGFLLCSEVCMKMPQCQVSNEFCLPAKWKPHTSIGLHVLHSSCWNECIIHRYEELFCFGML